MEQYRAFWTFRRFDLTSDLAATLNNYRWLSTAESILSPEPKCLEFIHRTAHAVASREIKLPEDKIEKLSSIRNGPLGRYFELLIGILFTLSPEIEASHSNVVVREGKTTRGEFDLLYKKGGNWYHLEMAVKFYLGVSDRTSAFNWHGPALRDNLGHKWERMSGHQLTLPKTDSGKNVLHGLSIGVVESEALILGRLFHSFSDWQANSFKTTQNISKNHANGWWIHARDAATFANTHPKHWLPLMKHQWLAQQKMHERLSKPNFKDLKHPQMYAIFEQIQQNQFQEIHRGFVVPDCWGPK